MPNSFFGSSRTNSSTVLAAGDVALTGLGGERSSRLALPVEQRGADRVVPIHRRGGVVGFRLLEGDEKQVDVLRSGVPDALAHAVWVPRKVERRQDLLALIAGVDLQRDAGEGIGRPTVSCRADSKAMSTTLRSSSRVARSVTQGGETLVDGGVATAVRPQGEQHHSSETVLGGGQVRLCRGVVAQEQPSRPSRGRGRPRGRTRGRASTASPQARSQVNVGRPASRRKRVHERVPGRRMSRQLKAGFGENEASS